MSGVKERQGDFVFTANEVGEYRFCFDNSVSTFSDKVVDFEISVCWLQRYAHLDVGKEKRRKAGSGNKS